MLKSSVCKIVLAGAILAPAFAAATAQGTSAPPAAPAPQGVAVPAPAVSGNPFPAPNLKNFTATTPSREDVDAFLTALWGYDANRIWSVQAVLATQAPGVAKIVVLIGDKTQPGKTGSTVFFTTPDGKHAISDNVIDFGVKPFAANRSLLQAHADGAARGATSKDLMLVEFADLQCPHCRDAQATMDSLVQDFPQARVVYENFPLTAIHPQAFRAAAVGECLRRSNGDAAFFTYAQAVYSTQTGLSPQAAEATLSAAVTRAGGSPAATSKCADTQPIKDFITAQMKFATDLGVDQTPTLAVNGHLLPITSIPYETLKRIVAFQAAQDGITVRLQPTLSNLK